MKLTTAVALFAFVITAGLLVRAQPAQGLARPYSPVTVAEAWQAVAGELQSRGFREQQLPRVENLELPATVPARAGRTLRVSSACWDADAERARFRIECREPGACLPFLAYLRDGSGAAAHAQAPSCRLERPGRRSSPAQRQPAEPTVRAGQRATAILTASGLRMTASVTCLDRGGRGEIVRVRGREGRVFRARVAGQALVEALPE